MAKNISLLGADYPDVPAVTLPQTGGGRATFIEESELGNYKIKKVSFTTGNMTMAANSYKKILNYSDIGTGIDITHIVSVTGRSSNVNCPYWFEVYNDGIYIYVGAAIAGKYVNVEVCYTDYAMDYRQITPSV